MRDYFAQHGLLPPSYARLGEVLGFGGKTAAVMLVRRLVSAGYVTAAPGGKVVPTGRFFELPHIEDKLPAGTGDSMNSGGGVDHHELDRLLVEHPSKTVLVPIRGDSMVEAGVLDGDTAIVERGQTAQAGEFVAALVDGQYTVKELRFDGSEPVLVPHNRLHKTIRPKQDLMILGVVRGIVRQYPRVGRNRKVRGAQV